MKFISSASIAVVASMMLITPSVTAMPRQSALEDTEVMNMDSILNELNYDPAVTDELFGFGGKPNLISRIVGGGIKGSIANQVAHRFLGTFSTKSGIDVTGIVDAIIKPEGPDFEAAFRAAKKNHKLAPIVALIERAGGVKILNGILAKLGGIDGILNMLQHLKKKH
ncbi:hypothetical protein K7432_006080 [Basidiobolus ranarum]|uniref:Uncharacterized protein n=1 Tax=Basidiobolus ranarum TaxID=34480 RepID=A0ABR2W2J4_9FUNG